MSKDPKVAYVAEWVPNHVSIDMPKHPPRLSVALLWANPGELPHWRTDLDKEVIAGDAATPRVEKRCDLDKPEEIERLLPHIYQRLEQGVDEAWYSKYAYDLLHSIKQEELAEGAKLTEDRSREIVTRLLERLTLLNEPEEQWARAFAEMFVYMPYAGPGMFMTSNGFKDYRVYLKWPNAYAIMAACQHLSTYGALTRGTDPSVVAKEPSDPTKEPGQKNPPRRNGMTAGSNKGIAVFGEPEKNVPPTKRPCWITDHMTEYEKCDLRPGDVVSGASNKDQNGWAHSATVLRRWPLGKAQQEPANAGAGAKLQMIDTGVLSGPTDGSTQDQEWQDGFGKFSSNAISDYRGFGRLAAVDQGDLVKAVATTKKARPMGFARLVVVESSGNVRYVSAVLPMWHGDLRFSIARYIWSLRNLPIIKGGHKVYWVILAPHGEDLANKIAADASRAWETELTRKDSRASLGIVAIITNEPRVLRTVTKALVGWRDVHKSEDGSSGVPTALTSFYDEETEEKAYKTAVDKAPTPEAKAAVKRPPPRLAYPMVKARDVPLNLEAAGDRPGGWAFMGNRNYLSTELVMDTDTQKLKERPKESNPVQYFNGKGA